MYKNSLIVSTSITVLQTLTASLAAFVFAKMRFPGKNFIFITFMAAMMVPAQLTIIPNYFIVKALGLMDSLGSLIALGAFSAFAIFLIRQFFMSLPLELDDAAKIDGCGYFRSYLLIHFPLAKSVLSVKRDSMLQRCLGRFLQPVDFLKSIQNMTLPLGLSMLQGMYSQQSPAVNVATMVVALIPVLIVFLIGRKTPDRGRCHNGHEDVARNFICGGNYDTGQGIVLFYGIIQFMEPFQPLKNLKRLSLLRKCSSIPIVQRRWI